MNQPNDNLSWEKEFRDRFGIVVTPDDEKDATKAFLMERLWQEHPLGEMVDFIKELLAQAEERGRLQARDIDQKLNETILEAARKEGREEMLDALNEFAADERDKGEKHYEEEEDDYSQGYYMAMNTVMKEIERRSQTIKNIEGVN